MSNVFRVNPHAVTPPEWILALDGRRWFTHEAARSNFHDAAKLHRAQQCARPESEEYVTAAAAAAAANEAYKSAPSPDPDDPDDSGLIPLSPEEALIQWEDVPPDAALQAVYLQHRRIGLIVKSFAGAECFFTYRSDSWLHDSEALDNATSDGDVQRAVEAKNGIKTAIVGMPPAKIFRSRAEAMEVITTALRASSADELGMLHNNTWCHLNDLSLKRLPSAEVEAKGVEL